VLNIHI